jgi:hypothetical protein
MATARRDTWIRKKNMNSWQPFLLPRDANPCNPKSNRFRPHILLRFELNASAHNNTLTSLDYESQTTINHTMASEQKLHTIKKRIEFALFLKVLLRYLQKSNQFFLLEQTRLVVSSCTTGHRMGDPSCSRLVESIETRLRKLVGEQNWRLAKGLTRYYNMARHQQRHAVLGSNLLSNFQAPIAQH